MHPDYTCLIVDDEPLAVELLVDSLRTVQPNVRILETFTSWTAALQGVRSIPCDLLFLDISIQGRNSMDLLQSVPNLRSEIIFVTAHSNYALRAFKFPTAGYLLKPVDEIELANTIDRAITRIDARRQAAHYSAPVSKIGIPDSRSITYVALHEILYLEAVNTYTKVVTRSGELISSYNLARFRELLPQGLFVQVHRSFIVNTDAIARYENSGVLHLDNGKELPVAKTARTKILSLFTKVRPGDGRNP